MSLPGGRHQAFEDCNRNKKGITLNLTKSKGTQVMHKLVEKSDVFVTNFRGAARQQLDYESLSRINPMLIYAFSGGLGENGPEAESPAYEMIALARSGAMLASGEEAMPPVYLGSGIGDRLQGVYLAYGVVAALLARERFGVGQKVALSLLQSWVAIQGLNLSSYLLLGKEYEREKRTAANEPLYNWYQCRDGKWIALAMIQGDRYWSSLCKALGIETLCDDPRYSQFQARMANREELITLLDKVFATKTREEWSKLLRETGCIFSPINRISDVPADPQVKANDYIVEWDHPTLGRIKCPGPPVKFSKTPATFRDPAPEFGQHTAEVLHDVCGYDWHEIEQLREEGVV